MLSIENEKYCKNCQQILDNLRATEHRKLNLEILLISLSLHWEFSAMKNGIPVLIVRFIRVYK